MPSSPAFAILQTPIIDKATGRISDTWLQQFRTWQNQLSAGFDANGNLTADILPSAIILGRVAIGTILQYITDQGIVLPKGMTSATSLAQGAVQLPAGAANNVLGSAAMQPSTAFDPAGAATTAQGASGTYTDTQVASTLAAAEAYASNASNLTSGSVNLTLIPGLTVTITTAALTSTGTRGSMTFTNGVLTSQTAAT